VLRRNPHYGGPRRPALDGLILRAGVATDQAAARVEQGRADYVADPGVPPAADFMQRGRLERRYGHPGGRLRFVRPPAGFSVLVLFNTRRGVFASAELRRAANFALDRDAPTGPGGLEPRTLLIPPGVVGYRPVQAYPVAGDLRRARTLAAGRGGTAVLAVRAGDPWFDPFVQQVRRAWARIGVRIVTRPFADPLSAASDPANRIDAVIAGWAPGDYPDPFDAVNVLLDPAARIPPFPDLFGDPRWVRRMHAAAAAPLERRDAAYARLDADLAHGPAPVAVLGSPPGTPQLYSARLGCERYVIGRLDVGALCVR
jgi:ABC-type transport system substrate-binding protein